MGSGPLGYSGVSMTREEQAKFMGQCKELVLGMSRLEQRIAKLDEGLTKEEQRTAFREIFEWLGTTMDIPPNSYSREWARELLECAATPVRSAKTCKRGSSGPSSRPSAESPS